MKKFFSKIGHFFKKLTSNIFVNVTAALVGLMAIFGVAISFIGYYSFENAFKNEYATVTSHMADSVAYYVKGDHLASYLNNEYVDEYNQTKEMLDTDCVTLHVSLIYVIQVDTTDYGSFVSIFNSVNNEVDNSTYTPWPLGYQRNTTNDEYRTKYQSLYAGKSQYETIFRTKTTDGQHRHITTMVPIKDSTNKVVGLLCMQRPINEMEKAFSPYLMFIIMAVILMAVVIVAISLLFINLSVLMPVQKASKEANRFAKEKTIVKPLGKISRYESLQNLASSLDSMEVDMTQYVENITKFTAEKEKIGAELLIASQIQQASIPQVFPAFPDRKDFDIYAMMDPAKEVGGDFYNFFLIDDDHLGLVIADVSDKGVPASLFMMVANILISEGIKVLHDPAKVLEYVNDNLYDHNQSGMFVTVWLGILELSTGKLVSANAGHEDPIIYHKGGQFVSIPEKHGFILAGIKGSQYKNQEITLGKGDKVFVFTDGVSEAKNEYGEMYTITRALRVLTQHKDESPKEILIKVKEDIDKFVSGAPQFDDLTMLCVELK